MIKKRTWKEFSIRSEGYFPNILKVNEKPTILTETLKRNEAIQQMFLQTLIISRNDEFVISNTAIKQHKSI